MNYIVIGSGLYETAKLILFGRPIEIGWNKILILSKPGRNAVIKILFPTPVRTEMD